MGSTFSKVVLDPDRDVLVHLYSPQCGHCRKLHPVIKAGVADRQTHTHMHIHLRPCSAGCGAEAASPAAEPRAGPASPLSVLPAGAMPARTRRGHVSAGAPPRPYLTFNNCTSPSTTVARCPRSGSAWRDTPLRPGVWSMHAEQVSFTPRIGLFYSAAADQVTNQHLNKFPTAGN